MGLARPSCTIHGLLASGAPAGVLLRRGPTMWTELVWWDTATDRFQRGQWFRGRIYTRRCDISPDGELFVYFAAKRGNARVLEGGYAETWTAVSRPPFYTALSLWPKGDSWDGGGWFAGPRELHLNHGCQAEPHPRHPVPKSLRVHTNACGRGEDLPIFDDVVRAKGWVRQGRHDDEPPLRAVRGPHAWVRRHPVADLALRMEFEGWDPAKPGGPLHFGFAITRTSDGEMLDVVDATWADWDQHGRLVYTSGGRLLAADPAGRRLAPAVLVDLTADVPERIEAPGWATRWPGPGARRPR